MWTIDPEPRVGSLLMTRTGVHFPAYGNNVIVSCEEQYLTPRGISAHAYLTGETSTLPHDAVCLVVAIHPVRNANGGGRLFLIIYDGTAGWTFENSWRVLCL